MNDRPRMSATTSSAAGGKDLEIDIDYRTKQQAALQLIRGWPATFYFLSVGSITTCSSPPACCTPWRTSLRALGSATSARARQQNR